MKYLLILALLILPHRPWEPIAPHGIYICYIGSPGCGATHPPTKRPLTWPIL